MLILASNRKGIMQFVKRLPADRCQQLLKAGNGDVVICNDCGICKCTACDYQGLTIRQALVISHIPVVKSLVTKFCPKYLIDDALSHLLVHLVKIIDNLPPDLSNFDNFLWTSLRGHLFNFLNVDGVIKGSRHVKNAISIRSIESDDAVSTDSTLTVDIQDLIEHCLSSHRDRTIYRMVSERYKMKEIASSLQVSDSYVCREWQRISNRLLQELMV